MTLREIDNVSFFAEHAQKFFAGEPVSDSHDDNDIKDGWRRQGRNLRSDEAKSPASKFVLRCFILLKKNIFYKKTLLQCKVNEYYFGA